MLNRVELIGRLGRDPEVRTMQSGGQVCNLSVATSETWRDKATGERKERTEWHRVVVFADGLVKLLQNYTEKGSLIYIVGKLQTRKWTDQTGVEKYSTEIVLQPFGGEVKLLSKRDGDAREENAGDSSDDPIDDDIPF